MSLRYRFLAAGLLLGMFWNGCEAQPLDDAADNPFIVRQTPLEANLEKMRAALRLSSEQERLFDAVAERLRGTARDREAAIVAAAMDRNREAQAPRDPGAALRARADRLIKYAENLRALADAETSFFASLSEEQKRIADMILTKDSLGLHDGLRRRARRTDGNG